MAHPFTVQPPRAETARDRDLEKLREGTHHLGEHYGSSPSLADLRSSHSQIAASFGALSLNLQSGAAASKAASTFRHAESGWERAMQDYTAGGDALSSKYSSVQESLSRFKMPTISYSGRRETSLFDAVKQKSASVPGKDTILSKWKFSPVPTPHNPLEHFKPLTQKGAGRFVREFGINTVHGIAKNLEVLGHVVAAPFKLWYDVVLKDEVELFSMLYRASPGAQQVVAEVKGAVSNVGSALPGYSWAKEKTKLGVTKLQEWHYGFNSSVDRLAEEYHRDYDIPKETTRQLKTDVPEAVIGLGLFLLPSVFKRGPKLFSNTALQSHFHDLKVAFPAGESGLAEATFRMHAAPQGEALIFAELSAQGATAQESLRGAVGILENELRHVARTFPEFGEMKLSMSVAEDSSQFAFRMQRPVAAMQEAAGVVPLNLPRALPARFLPAVAEQMVVAQTSPTWLVFAINGVGQRHMGQVARGAASGVRVSGAFLGDNGEIFRGAAASSAPKPPLIPETPVELALEQYGALGISGLRFQAPHEPIQGVTLLDLAQELAAAAPHSSEHQVASKLVRDIVRNLGSSLADLHNKQPFHYLPATAASIQADVAHFRQVTVGVDRSLLDLSTEELTSRFNPAYLEHAERRFREADNVASLELGNADPAQIRYLDGELILQDPNPLAASMGLGRKVTRAKDLAAYRLELAKLAGRLSLSRLEAKMWDLELVRGYTERFSGEFIAEADEFYRVQRPYELLGASSSRAPEAVVELLEQAAVSNGWLQETYRVMDLDIPHEHGTGLALFSYAMREDGTMGCFLDYVLAIQNSSLKQFPATPTLSTVFTTLQAIGRANGAKKILVQFFPANKRLEAAIRRYMIHIGDEKFFFPWLSQAERRNYYTYASEPLEMLEIPCPVFELPMEREWLLNSLRPEVAAAAAPVTLTPQLGGQFMGGELTEALSQIKMSHLWEQEFPELLAPHIPDLTHLTREEAIATLEQMVGRITPGIEYVSCDSVEELSMEYAVRYILSEALSPHRIILPEIIASAKIRPIEGEATAGILAVRHTIPSSAQTIEQIIEECHSMSNSNLLLEDAFHQLSLSMGSVHRISHDHFREARFYSEKITPEWRAEIEKYQQSFVFEDDSAMIRKHELYVQRHAEPGYVLDPDFSKIFYSPYYVPGTQRQPRGAFGRIYLTDAKKLIASMTKKGEPIRFSTYDRTKLLHAVATGRFHPQLVERLTHLIRKGCDAGLMNNYPRTHENFYRALLEQQSGSSSAVAASALENIID